MQRYRIFIKVQVPISFLMECKFLYIAKINYAGNIKLPKFDNMTRFGTLKYFG